jgi:hypothetical protein
MSIADTVPPPKDLSVVLGDIAARTGADGRELGAVLQASDKRGYALFLLLAFALLILPIDIGLPQFAALTLIVCGLALMGGATAPYLPGFIGKRRLKKTTLESLASFAKNQESWSQLLLQPRFAEFAAMEKLVGLLIVVLGALVAAPGMPDLIAALAVLTLALGMLQRDGLVMLIGVAIAVGWIAFVVAMVTGAAMNAPYGAGWLETHAKWASDLLANLNRPAAP